jgi:hypothetical protein
MRQSPYPLWLPIVALLLAVAHLAFEHFTGGVQSHHLLNNAELPAISNWFELLTLPIIGAMLAWYCQRQPAHQPRVARVPVTMLIGLIGGAVYGAILAISFSTGMMMLTQTVFFGLLLCAVLLPIYQLQYICGFVLAMTFTFGGILPLLIAGVLALLSWCSRFVIASVVTFWRKHCTGFATPN